MQGIVHVDSANLSDKYICEQKSEETAEKKYPKTTNIAVTTTYRGAMQVMFQKFGATDRGVRATVRRGKVIAEPEMTRLIALVRGDPGHRSAGIKSHHKVLGRRSDGNGPNQRCIVAIRE
jgi:hypothetical protein